MLLFLQILVHFTTLRALFEFWAQTHFFLSFRFFVSGKTVLTVKGPTTIIAVDMGRLSFLIIRAFTVFSSTRHSFDENNYDAVHLPDCNLCYIGDSNRSCLRGLAHFVIRENVVPLLAGTVF